MFSKVLGQGRQGNYPPGLSEKTIKKVSIFCEEYFDCSLPKGYANFLKEANGFSYDGRSIFCCYNDEIQKNFSRYTGLDFMTFNLKFYESTDISEYLVLGKSSIDYVCFEKATGKYQILTNGTMNLLNESTNFERLIELFYEV